MTFLVTLICSTLAVLALRKPLHRMPIAFYVLAIAIDCIGLFAQTIGLPRSAWIWLYALEQRALLPLALFGIVMFIGCFDRDSRVGKLLRPIRSEISIIAWILSLEHVVVYTQSYLPRILSNGTLTGNLVAGFCVAVALLILLLVLGVTSFTFVKRRMSKQTWAAIQRFAYLFFALVFVHVLLMLAPSAFRGGQAAQISILVYCIMFATYAAMRIAKASRDKRTSA